MEQYTYSPKALETSVVVLYGVGLNQPGNTTIAGHNYRNGLFFSNNKKYPSHLLQFKHSNKSLAP